MTEPTLSAAPQPALEAALKVYRERYEQMPAEMDVNAAERFALEAAIAAYSAAQQKVPETGEWRLVPVKPTPEAIEAICRAGTGSEWPGDFDQAAQDIRRYRAAEIYTATLVTAPAKPQPPETPEQKAGELGDLRMPSMYRSVPSITTDGTGPLAQKAMPDAEGLIKRLTNRLALGSSANWIESANLCQEAAAALTAATARAEKAERERDEAKAEASEMRWLWHNSEMALRAQLATIRAETVAECEQLIWAFTDDDEFVEAEPLSKAIKALSPGTAPLTKGAK